MSNPPLTEHRPDLPICLMNLTCPYCHERIGREGKESNREHVVGRNFVPQDFFHNQWNLITWACVDCNDRKSELEGEISAITLQPDVWGRYATDHPHLVAEAARKAARADSKRTQKLVKDSTEQVTIGGQVMPGLSFKAGMVAPPQLMMDRVNELAGFHLAGFHYLITYDKAKRIGYGPGFFESVMFAPKVDWGNQVFRWFQDHVAGWSVRLHGVTSQSFFKIAIRRPPGLRNAGSFALEWNRAFRMVGFFGIDQQTIQQISPNIPELKKIAFRNEDGSIDLIRGNVELPEHEDRLFDPPAMCET